MLGGIFLADPAKDARYIDGDVLKGIFCLNMPLEIYSVVRNGSNWNEIGYINPILERGSTVLLLLLCMYVTLRGPPLISEMGWTGELWSKTKFLILEN